MKTYIISDTHFNHNKPMIEWCGRPKDFNDILWKNLNLIGDNDMLIHLGDICIGKDLETHDKLSKFKFKKILVKGNHDRKSNNWYLEHGWDFVCEEFKDSFFGKNILFSHMPRVWDGVYDINIHGHFHNSDHRRHEPELLKIENGYQKLYAPEYENYYPLNLEKFIK